MSINNLNQFPDPVRILFLEDVENDARLIWRALEKDGINFDRCLVDNRDDYIRELTGFRPDIIISDFSLPSFDGMSALFIRNENYPGIPFILVTGSINEEVAVECIKSGADDYLLKHNLSRLGQAVIAALSKYSLLKSKEKAEDELRNTETIFSAFLEHSPVYVFFKDDNIRTLRLSKNYEQMLGVPVKEALGKTMDDLFPSELSKSMIRDDLNVLRENKPIRVVEELSGRTYETTKFPITGADGSRMLAGFTLDITDRIKIENELNKSKKEFQNYFEKSSVGLTVTNTAKKWIKVNQKFCEMLGYSKEELSGLSWSDLSHSDELEENLRLFESALNGEIDYYELDKKLYRKDGTLITVSLSVVCQRKTDGSIDHFLASYVDITERKRVEQELIIAKEKAEESDRLKTSFLQNISHEIRTPMNAIVGFASFLRDPNLDFESRDAYAEIILKSSNHLLSIFTDIIDFSNIEANTVKILKETANLNGILKLIFEQVRTKYEEKQILLETSLGAGDSDSTILVDITKLNQVIVNLINNALKFTYSGYVRFGYVIKGKEIEFFVMDTGIGIADEHRTRIFEKFYQADNSLTRASEGTGLGLSICKAYVEKMGGKIWFESELNSGTTFYFTIPYEKPAEQPEGSVTRKREKGFRFSKPLKILVAEDIESNFKLINFFLSGAGASVIRAENGKEAVDLATQCGDFDLILMDVKMPVMDGYTAVQLIRESGIKIPIIAQTAYADDRSKALELGCTGFISKPFDRQKLINTICQHI